QSEAALAAALYYIVHSTLTGAGLFLLAGLMAGRSRDMGVGRPGAQRQASLGTLFFLLAIALVGLPPLAGSVGKVLILDAARASGQVVLVWSVILATSLVLLIGFVRLGIRNFWTDAGARIAASGDAMPAPRRPLLVVATLVGLVALSSLLAGPMLRDMTAAASQLLGPAGYVSAVLPATPATEEQ